MDNINPKIWGRGAWTFLHSIMRAYPTLPTEDNRKQYREFIENLKYVIPCEKCRVNYTKDIQTIPLDSQALTTKTTLLDWWVRFRNEENKNIGKPAQTLAEYDAEVFSPPAKKTDNCSITTTQIIFIVIVCLLLAGILFKLK